MLRLHQYFIRNYIFIFVVTGIFGAVVSYFTIENLQIKRLERTLKATIETVKLQKDLSISQVKLQKLARDVNKITDNRVTFIDANGVVLSDSNYDFKKMENHGNRPEIVEAKKKRFGVNLRFSHTLQKDFLYVANRFKIQNQNVFIRLATDTQIIKKSFINLWKNVMYIFISAFAVLFMMSFFMSQKIQNEIDKIITNLQNIANKKYKSKITSSYAKEFADIASYMEYLAHKLSRRDKQKRKHMAKLKLLNSQRSQIISAISHEFKNPIASIMGYATTILDDEDMKPEIKKRFLTKIVTNSEKITDMIDRLSFSTKLENGDLVPNFMDFDLSILVKDVVDEFKARYENRNFDVKLTPLQVRADANMIEMVLTNLIDNALKYSSSDIVVEVANGECKVTDFGEGISEKDIPKITKKFYRCDKHSWDNSIGLGLSLVSYLLKLNNSELKIHSKLNSGSTFYFQLG